MRGDFRRTYHVAYDDVPTDEALDLIAQLPSGSAYLASINPADAWDETQYLIANLVDAVNVMAHGMRYTEDFKPVMTPARRAEAKRVEENTEKAKEKVREVKRKLENTKWKEVD